MDTDQKIDGIPSAQHLTDPEIAFLRWYYLYTISVAAVPQVIASYKADKGRGAPEWVRP